MFDRCPCSKFTLIIRLLTELATLRLGTESRSLNKNERLFGSRSYLQRGKRQQERRVWVKQQRPEQLPTYFLRKQPTLAKNL